MQRMVGVIGAMSLFAAASGSAWAQEAAPAAPPAAEAAPPAPAQAIPSTPAEATPAAPTAPAPAAGPPMFAYAARRAAPGLVMMKAGNAAFGLLGMPAMIAASKKLIEDYKIEDPNDALAAQLAGQLAAAQSGSVASAPILIDPTEKKVVNALVAGNVEKAKYIVVLGVSGVTVVYYPTDWTHYQLIYGVGFSVLDGATGKEISKGKCAVKPGPKPADAPTEAQLIENDAALLKAMLKSAAEACAPQLQAAAKI